MKPAIISNHKRERRKSGDDAPEYAYRYLLRGLEIVPHQSGMGNGYPWPVGFFVPYRNYINQSCL